jgi:ubiquinone/menaquinone biosynthesis C-methylase UbiE
MSNEMDSVTRYYDECYLYYKIFWHSHKNLCLHYGFHDKGQRHDKAVVRMIEVLADKVKVTSKDSVLDAGCGVGGSSVWLAQNIGCKVLGIDINHNFINIAKREAKKRNLDSLVSFHEMNFCQAAFRENVFDIVWALESSCHAEDKQAFLMEMSRILKPGGHIVIADVYKTRESSELTNDLMGWAVPNIPGVAEFTDYLAKAGFRHVVYEKINEKVAPSSLRIYCLAWIAYPLVMLLRLLRQNTELSINAARFAFKQYSYGTKGPVEYCIFVAEKAIFKERGKGGSGFPSARE